MLHHITHGIRNAAGMNNYWRRAPRRGRRAGRGRRARGRLRTARGAGGGGARGGGGLPGRGTHGGDARARRGRRTFAICPLRPRRRIHQVLTKALALSPRFNSATSRATGPLQQCGLAVYHLLKERGVAGALVQWQRLSACACSQQSGPESEERPGKASERCIFRGFIYGMFDFLPIDERRCNVPPGFID